MANNEISKNIYEIPTSKGTKEITFCTNLDTDFFKNKEVNKYNSKYFMQKNIIKEYFNDKERIYLGKKEFNNGKTKFVEIDILKIKYHKSIVDEYIDNIKNYYYGLNLMALYEIKATISYRLVVGLGNPSVTETSMTLHNIYGIPYIPGQALKGITRSYFLQKYYDVEQNTFHDIEFTNKKINSKNLYKNIFGDDFNIEDNEKGHVIFLDSFPTSDEITIEKDVMTPHYGKYYEDGKELTDKFDTKPIPFYTIKDTKFNFMFAIRKDKIVLNEKENIKFQIMGDFVWKLIKEALEDHGIGAKTSVGYGYFEEMTKEECLRQTEDNNKRIEEIIEKEKIEKQKRLKEEEKLRKKIEQEEKFKERTKGMTEFEISLFKIEQIEDKKEKHNSIMKFYNDNIEIVKDKEQIQLAEHMKIYLESIDQWNPQNPKKNKKKNKKLERIEKICKILKIEIS